jgi:hypothetical protein
MLFAFQESVVKTNTQKKVALTRPCDENLKRVLRLTREMLALADEGDRDRADDSCGILYGVLRDAAYRIRSLSEEEIQRHHNRGNTSAD